MTVQVIQLFAPTVLTNAAATLYTVPSLPSNIVLGRGRIRFTNTTGGSITVTAYAIPSGGSAAVGNCFLDAQAIPALGNLDVDVPVMIAASFIQALASANTSITAQVLDGVLFS